MSKNFIALTCAVTCSFLWGTAFIAQDTGMDFIGPWTFSAARLLLGFFALLPFFFIFEFKKIKAIKSNFKIIIFNMLLLGFFLGNRSDGFEGFNKLNERIRFFDKVRRIEIEKNFRKRKFCKSVE